MGTNCEVVQIFLNCNTCLHFIMQSLGPSNTEKSPTHIPYHNPFMQYHIAIPSAAFWVELAWDCVWAFLMWPRFLLFWNSFGTQHLILHGIPKSHGACSSSPFYYGKRGRIKAWPGLTSMTGLWFFTSIGSYYIVYSNRC